ncbi:hypothetical protein J6590_052940, partial [Homalodisca vitripennis]
MVCPESQQAQSIGDPRPSTYTPSHAQPAISAGSKRATPISSISTRVSKLLVALTNLPELDTPQGTTNKYLFCRCSAVTVASEAPGAVRSFIEL